MAAAMVIAPAARAQSSNTLYVRAIDASDERRATVDYVVTAGGGESAQLAINKQPLTPQTITTIIDASPKPEIGVSLVVDTGPNMSNTSALVTLKDRAKEFVKATTGKGVLVAVYQAGDKANIVQSFTADLTKLDNAIDRLTPTKSSAIWSALRLAGGGYGQENRIQPNIVLAVGDDDAVSPNDQSAARGTVLG